MRIKICRRSNSGPERWFLATFVSPLPLLASGAGAAARPISTGWGGGRGPGVPVTPTTPSVAGISGGGGKKCVPPSGLCASCTEAAGGFGLHGST